MPIQAPNLDDRNFDQLLAEARRLIQQKSPDWTDLGASDPGVVLIEVFAYLTDVLLYRLNRIPEKAYIQFLRLIGVRVQPPGAASVALRFSTPRPLDRPVEIPRGTRVTVARAAQAGEGPIFATADAVGIPAQGTEVVVPAYHAETVEGELAGVGTGRPGLSVTAARPPIVAPTGDGLDLLVGVEATPDELSEHVTSRRLGDRTFRIWSEVDSFATTGPADLAYVVDRLEGLITFAPAARQTDPATGQLSDAARELAAVPSAGREIRLWYRRGGGADGNVPAGSLTVLKDPVPGVDLAVSNPTPASGGRAAETVQNALVRGPQDLHSLNRAVTARDFELNATSFGAVARARALTRASQWTFAKPGEVEVVLVPELPAAQRPQGRVTADALRAQQTEEALRGVKAQLDERRPLGTACVVTWAGYKSVAVQARLHVRREEDAPGVRDRVLNGLYGTISPLPSQYSSSGWAFGQPLRVSDVYYVAQREPGVRYVDSVRLHLDEVPDQDVTSIVADPFQPRMWYVASGARVFTSRDDGAGWEPAGGFPEEAAVAARTHDAVPGLVALATRTSPKGSRLYVSEECGENWRKVAETTDFTVTGLTWISRDGQQLLLLATDSGLYELGMQPDAVPVQVLVDTANASRPLNAVAAAVVRGVSCVAVATQGEAGLFLSRDGGRNNSFRSIGLAGEDIRVLAVQHEDVRRFLWAGQTVQGVDDPGKGCFSWELAEADPPEGWVSHARGWSAGSVRAIAFQGRSVLSASHHGGVMRLASRAEDQAWQMPDVNSGLPLRDPGRFDPVDAVAAEPGTLIMAGGAKGVVLSRDGGVTYTSSSKRVLTTEEVTVPATWLLCSGEHQIEVVSE